MGVATRQLCVMIVDDDEDLRQTLTDVLAAWGYKVCTAQNGYDALQQLENAKPSVVLLDLMMPVVNGWQFVHEVEARHLDLNIIVMTAAHPDDVPAAYPVLHKPMGLDAVKSAIEGSCQRA